MEMYTIHARCSLNVTDDSGGNVYICAFENNPDRANVKNYIRSNHLTNPAIVGLPFLGGDQSNNLSANITRVVEDIDDPGSNIEANVDTPYYIYALAIDNYYNVSELKESPANGNVIRQQAAPNTREELDAQMVESNISLSGNIYTTVPYDYQTVSFTYRESNTANIQRFFDDFVDNPVDVTEETVHALDRDITDVFYNDTESNIDFDPFLDTTRDHYAYLYVHNKVPHDSNSNIEEHRVPRLHEPRPDTEILVQNPVHERLRDFTANVSFEVGNVENTEYFVGVYSNAIAHPETNGPFKRHMITHGVNGTPTETTVNLVVDEFFFDEHDPLAKNLQTRTEYYMYVLLRDTQTGQYTRSTIETKTFNTGAPPVVLSTSGENTRNQQNYLITVRATVEEENVAGPNVYAIAFDDINANVTLDKFDVLRSKATHLKFDGSWSGQQEISGNINMFYTGSADDVDTTTNPGGFHLNKNMYIHLLLEDPLMNRDLFAPTTYNGLIGYESQFVTKNLHQENLRDTMLDANLSDGSPDTILSSPVGSQTMTIEFTFENTHKICLSQMFLDLSNVMCSNVSSFALKGKNDGDANYSIDVAVVGQSTGFEKHKKHTINFNTGGENLSKLSHFRVELRTDDPSVVIGGLRFRGTVFDDRKPIFANTDTVVYNKDTNDVTLDLEDYSNVEGRIFRSLHYWANPDEQSFLFEQGAYSQTFEGPMYTPTDVTFETVTTVLNVLSSENDRLLNTSDYNPATNHYYTYILMTDSPEYPTSRNRADPKIFGNTGGIAQVPTSIPVVTLNTDTNVTRGFYDQVSGETRVHIEGNVLDSVSPVKWAIDMYNTDTSRSPDQIPLGDWADYNLNPGTLTNIAVDRRETTNSERVVEGETYTITMHAMNSHGLSNTTVSFQTELVEQDPVLRLNHLQWKNNKVCANIHFTDNLSDAHVYGALFNGVFPVFDDDANVKDYLYNNQGSKPIKIQYNVFDESFTFEFDEYIDIVTNQATPVSEDGVYYMYLCAIENRDRDGVEGAFKVRACTFGPNAGSITIGLNEHTAVIDGHTALLSAVNETINLTHEYLLVNLWTYPTVNSVGLPIVETDDFLLRNDSTFGSFVFQNKSSSSSMNIDQTALIAKVWNNIVLEVNGSDVNLYVNGRLHAKTSDLLGYTSSNSLTVHGNVDMGVDATYFSTFKPFQTNPSFTSIAATDHTDTFAPTVYDLVATQESETVVRVRANVIDQFPSNAQLALLDTYYGSVEPYANLESNLDSFFQQNVAPIALATEYMSKNRASVDVSLGVAYPTTRSVSAGPVTATGSYHAYMKVYDESARANQRIIYVSQVLGSGLTSEFANVTRFAVADGDDKVRGIEIDVDNTTPSDFVYQLAAYPRDFKSTETDAIREDFVRVHMNANAPAPILLTDGVPNLTTYFVDETDTAGTTPLEYATHYDVYALLTNVATREQTVVGPGLVFTAVAPTIDNLRIDVESDFNIRLTGNVVEESVNTTVYAAVFAPNENDETRIKDFFTSAEFVDDPSTKLEMVKPVDGVIGHVFTNYHNNVFFHDDVRAIVSADTDYKIVVYVKDHDHETYHEFYRSSNVTVNYPEDIDVPLIQAVNVTPHDLAANVSFQTEDNENTVDVRVVAFTSDVTTDAARDFLRHANIDGIGFSVDDAANVATAYDARLERAIDSIEHLSTSYAVDIDANGNVTFNGHVRPDIHVFNNRVYTFNVASQSGLRFYLSNVQDVTASAIDGSPEISYITTDGQEFNTGTELDNIAYVRYKVPSSRTGLLYYGLWDSPMKGGTITVLDASDSSSFPVVETTDNTRDYHAYVFARDNSRRENNNIVGVTYRVGAPPVIVDFSAEFIVI